MIDVAWFMRVARAFARRELLSWSAHRMALAMRVLAVLFAAVSLTFFSRFVGAAANPHLGRYGGGYLAFALVGLVAADLQQVGLAGLSQRIRMAQLMGTMEAELSTPAPAWIVLGAAPVYELGGAALRAMAYLGGATVLLGVRLDRADWLSVAVTLPLVLAAFGGLGLLGAAATMLARRANPVALLVGGLSVLLSGVVYPVSVLPPWLRPLAALLPLTHALEALRGGLLAGASPAELRAPLLALATFAVILIPAGLAAFALCLKRARVDGSLTHY